LAYPDRIEISEQLLYNGYAERFREQFDRSREAFFQTDEWKEVERLQEKYGEEARGHDDYLKPRKKARTDTRVPAIWLLDGMYYDHPVKLFNEKSERLESVLYHEVQHQIQRIEGFGRGSNGANGYDEYRRTSGEVESRNVQERLNLTPEERRRSLAEDTEDVPRENQIVRFGSGENAYIGKNKRAQYEQQLAKAGYDEAEIKKQLDFLHELEQNKENDKIVKLAVDWMRKKGIQAVDDKLDDIKKAIKVAELAKADPASFRSPQEVFDAFPEHVQRVDESQRIDPATVPTLSNPKDMGHGVVVYDVADTKEAQQDMRQIINTHFGKDANPWCLLQGDGEGNLSGEAWGYWNTYNAYPKQVAFKDGKLLAFSANNRNQTLWWDRSDAPHGDVFAAGIDKTVEQRPDGTRVERETSIDGEVLKEREYAADGTSKESEWEYNEYARRDRIGVREGVWLPMVER